MLELKQIHKEYDAGGSKVTALNDVTVSFRRSEFAAILGPSGCGKTTLLNIIGGLDQYTSGDLIINGRSTKDFAASDWDNYRNHSIGFVFQSYNLIPHQTVLSNVELALTLSGVSKAERRRRAEEVLRKVGLENQIHKKPNQMSGGQMQRVAIARALVNDPDIILADEPTGALDSETSVQIMEILKEISGDKLIIMVTHNPSLAEKYATRTIKLLDGRIISDSDPFDAEAERRMSDAHADGAVKPSGEEKSEADESVSGSSAGGSKKRGRKRGAVRERKPSMSPLTALSLSFNNLLTKKARTLLTSFAGSIGIIGIALILSVSSGVQGYINEVQRDTLSQYPITIYAESMDLSSLITTLMDANSKDGPDHELDGIYSNPVFSDIMDSFSSANINTNNLKAFKEFIESDPEFAKYMSALSFGYNLDINIYTKDDTGKIIESDVEDFMNNFLYGSSSSGGGLFSMGFTVWEEMLPSDDGMVNETLKNQYDVIYGSWPSEYNEVVIVVDENNEIPDLVLYALGLMTQSELISGTSDKNSWSYEEICGRDFRVILSPDKYQKQADGTYLDISESDAGLDYLYSYKAMPLKVTGVIRKNPDSTAAMLSGSIGYTEALTKHIIEVSHNSDVVKDQLANPDIDVITGLPFETGEETELTREEKIAWAKKYLSSLDTAGKADFYISLMSVIPEDQLSESVERYVGAMTREQIVDMIVEAYAKELGLTDTTSIRNTIEAMSDEEIFGIARKYVAEAIKKSYAETIEKNLSNFTDEELAAMLDAKVFTDDEYEAIYDSYAPDRFSDGSYNGNLRKIGYVDLSDPSSINIYTSSFEDKDEIARLISEYNSRVEEADKITYTDYVAMLMSSITTIINAISYVLIAFVAISLVVSSIMIGIITYISVLERTKEIGVLRAIGASKRDVSRVFNAETLIVGFTAGIIGIGGTLFLNIFINIILHSLTGISALKASLPVAGAIILVVISMFLTFIAGLIPSRLAAKKDPVVALRTE